MSLVENRPGWRIGVVLIALIVLLIGYFWVHKPLDLSLLFNLGGAALDVLTISLIASIAGGLGRRMLQPIDLNVVSWSERIALEGSVGLGVLSILALALAAAGLYTGSAFWLLFTSVAVLGNRALIEWLRELLAGLKRTMKSTNGWSRWLMLVTLALLIMSLLRALGPPTAYDALNYHLVGPKHYLAAGRLVAIPENVFMGFPQGAEILYGAAMSLFGRDTAPALLHAWFGVVGLLAIGGLVRRYADHSTAWLAVTLLMSAYSIWLLFSWSYVDLAMMACGALAFISVVRWRESGDWRWLMLTGLWAGLALTIKYTALGLIFALAVYVIWSRLRQSLRNAAILGLVVWLVFLPWAVKGIVLYHNPFYPFVFGGVNWDAGRAATFTASGSGLSGSEQAWHLPILPVAATIFGVEKGERYSFTVGPWLLTAPALLILGWRWLSERSQRLAREGLRLALPLLLYWIFLAATSGIGAQTRLMMMGMPVAACLAGLGFHSVFNWPRKPLDIGFLLRAMLTLTFVLSLLEASQGVVKSKIIPYLLGQVDREQYLFDHLGTQMLAVKQLAELPPGAQALFLFEPRSYYCPPHVTCRTDILFDIWARPLQQGMTPDEVFQSWQAAGWDYVLVFESGFNFVAQDPRFARENALLPDALKQWMMPVWSDEIGGYTLYHWK
jgi:hypothetical protein